MLIQIGGTIIAVGLLLGFITAVFGRITSRGIGIGIGYPEGKNLIKYNWGLLITIILIVIGGIFTAVGKYLHQHS